MRARSRDLVITMRLLDHLKLRGFQFWRDAAGQDGPLMGKRITDEVTVLVQTRRRR